MEQIILNSAILAKSRIIAKGRRIRDVERLASSYGGLASRWVKKSSPVLEDADGTFEFHWYEHPGIGRVEIKRKQVVDP